MSKHTHSHGPAAVRHPIHAARGPLPFRLPALFLPTLLSALALSACDTARPLPQEERPKTDAQTEIFAPECHACHGSPNTPAPPKSVAGETDPKLRGVGAHTIHLSGGASAGPVACKACHKVPESIWDIDHIDPTPGAHATLTFGGLALAGGATPTYDPQTLTCSNVYCHGSQTKTPGANSAPIWNVVDASQRQCGSCHGAPPAAPHPQGGDCVDCHALTAGPNRTISNKANHINGKVEVALSGNNNCTGCHGAPPVTDKHPKTNDKCQGCHATSVNADQLPISGGAHMNGKPDVVLSANPPCAGCHGAPPSTPKHPKTNGNCSGCHATTVDADGKILAASAHNNGKIDVALSATPDCAGCHGNPPVSAKHPVSTAACSGCHAGSVDAAKTIVPGGTHNNGKVEVKLGTGVDCAGCHGAPPISDKHPKVDLANPDAVQKCDGCHSTTVLENDTLIEGGAHMNGKTDVSIGTKTSACAACHGAPPVNAKHPKVDPKHPEVVQKCDGCHSTTVDANEVLLEAGAHMNGKTDVAIGTKTSGCAGCHASPPVTATHPKVDPANPDAVLKCDGCHGTTVNALEQVIDGGAHLNGVTDVVLGATTNCSGCHGAPPLTAKHPKANPADPSAILACDGCHSATVDNAQKLLAAGAHLNGNVDVNLGTTTKCAGCHGAPPTTGAHPKADPANPTAITQCESCHAQTAGPNQTLLSGGLHSNGKVEVLVAGGLNCNACHGAPPVTANHPKVDPANPEGVLKCDGCHSTTVNAQQQIVAGGAHMDGDVDVALSATPNCGGCHGSPPVTANHPKLNPADPTAIGKCETCHAQTASAGQVLVPGGPHQNGSVEVKVVGGADCTACHAAPPTANHPVVNANACGLCHASAIALGNTPVEGGTHNNGTVDFSIDGLACTTCHGAPPSTADHPKMNACEKCHGTTVAQNQLIVTGGTHVNGTIDVAVPVAGPWVKGEMPAACGLCHGSGGSAAPPPDVNGNTDPTLASVGAHAAHLFGKTYSGGGIKCATCHVLPVTVDEPGHLLGLMDSVKFPNGQAAGPGQTPDYNPATLTCSSVYCHGSAAKGGTLPSPVWNQPNIACDSCHAVPPAPETGHPVVGMGTGTLACALCHAGTVNADGTLNLKDGKHVNGMVNP